MTALPCIHIGYPKAASKTLQLGLFNRHSQIKLIGKPYEYGDPIVDWITELHMQDSLQYNAEKSEQEFDRLVRPLIEGDRTLVLSWELFTLPQYVDRGLIAERLHHLFGQARIIVNIRNQLDQLKSMYLFQRARYVHSYSLQDYIARNEREYTGSWLDYLDYWKIVEAYARLFGHDNVGVFLFEDLVRDPQEYARQLCSFVGVDGEEGVLHISGVHENRGRSAWMSAYTRLRKSALPQLKLAPYVPASLRRGFHQMLEMGPKAKFSIPDELACRIHDRYRVGNRRLAQEMGLQLEACGYPT